MKRSPAVLCGAWLVVAVGLRAQDVRFNEIGATGASTFLDEDGASSDWVELINADAQSVNLDGWALTDDPALARTWLFPAVSLEPGALLVVFASAKDRRVPGSALHTSFKLDSGGEFLALLRPDGSVAEEFSPAYPKQHEGHSYGVAREEPARVLVSANAPARVLVPTSNTLGRRWTGSPADEPFADSAAAGWATVTLGVGFDTGEGGVQPLAYWSFDDATDPNRAVDSSPSAAHGVVSTHFALAGNGGNRKPLYTAAGAGHSAGAGDRALDFGPSGTGGLVRVPAAETGLFDPAMAADAITLSLWVKGGTDQPANTGVFWGSSETNGGGIRSLNAHIPWSDSTIYWDTAGCCDGTQRIFKHEPDPNRYRVQWNHYVFVKRGDQKEIWQNGVLFHEGANTANLTQVRGFWIGGPLNAGGWTYGGLIDDFTVWSEALLPEQIQALAIGASPLRLSSLTPFFATDVGAAMRGTSASLFVRIPFEHDPQDEFDELFLRVRFDDGFAAYLNGVEVARRNAPAALTHDSLSLTERTAGAALTVEEIPLSVHKSLLRAGRNILAFQLLNSHADDAEVLLAPELLAVRTSPGRFLVPPTPGAPNQGGVAGFVEEPEVSVPRGWQDTAQSVAVSTTTVGAAIWCSLDGSEPAPGQAGSFQYTAPITVSTTTKLRCRAFLDGFAPSRTVTHTYLFLAQVQKQPARPAGVPTSWAGIAADYEVDPDVVNRTEPGYSFADALGSLPVVCLTFDPDDLFGAGDGIYYNSQSRAEKPASLEWIDFEGRRGFQIDAGARIHGYTSRDHGFTPKHSFRVHFRSEYGKKKLEFPLFEDSKVDRFDQIVFRGMSTDSWPVMDGWPGPGPEPLRWYREKSQYLREGWMKDSMLDTGQPAEHHRFVHLFLNGLYWGLYHLTERPTDSFHGEHFGGEKEEHDVLKDFAELQSGTGDAWSAMIALAAQGFASQAAYQKIQGLNVDGSVNPAYPRYLDVDNLIDYMIVHIYAGADDWPDHNWWTGRRRGPLSEGFRFFPWDQEITNNSLGRTRTSWGAIFEEVSAYNTPAYLYAQLRGNVEYRLRFADHVHRHLFGGGALTPEANIDRWLRRADEIDRAIVAESARWGDYRRAVPFKREVEWLSEQSWLIDEYFPGVHSIALQRFRRVGLYPTVAAPTPSRRGGWIDPGFALTLTAPQGVVHYTIDGSDPRRVGGAVAAGALRYAAPIVLDRTTRIKARALVGTTWSALSETFLTVDVPLRITELHYHPAPPEPGSLHTDEDFEFLEIQNVGGERVHLAGLRLRGGVEFDFGLGAIAFLDPGTFVVVVRDQVAFRERYPESAVRVAGEYSGELRNRGESIELLGPRDEPIHRFIYSDLWYPETDGAGFSLEIRDASASHEAWTVLTGWRPSAAVGGTPGFSDGGLQVRGDLNQDAHVDLSDAVGLLFHLFLDPPGPLPCGTTLADSGNRALLDSNGDGGVDVSDVVHVLAYLFTGAPGGALTSFCVAIPDCPSACGR